jgi:hypothetical protein
MKTTYEKVLFKNNRRKMFRDKIKTPEYISHTTLSDKIIHVGNSHKLFINLPDVKEFIIKLKNEINSDDNYSAETVIKIINNFSGKQLIT